MACILLSITPNNKTNEIRGLMMSKPLVVAITGATGVIYGIELLKALQKLEVPTHLILSESAIRNIKIETDYSADEVKEMAIPVLRHRLALTPEAEIEGLGPDDCIQRLLENVPIPR